jgi:hypothetical protein
MSSLSRKARNSHQTPGTLPGSGRQVILQRSTGYVAAQDVVQNIANPDQYAHFRVLLQCQGRMIALTVRK